MRRGRLVVREWLDALCSCSGATHHTSVAKPRAISSESLIPGDPMPSSFVTRMRALVSSICRSAIRFDHLLPSHIGLQYPGDRHGAVMPLEVFEDRDQCAADRQAGAVEGMYRHGTLPACRPVAGLHAPGL